MRRTASAILMLMFLAVAGASAGADDRVEDPAKALVHEYEVYEQQVQAEASRKLEPRRQRLLLDLVALQESLNAEGDHEGAELVRARLRQLEEAFAAETAMIHPDPGSLVGLPNARPGDVMFFRVTGRTSGGSVWGTDLYTLDSRLAVAAVHTGAANAGEEAVVKVTFAPGQSNYAGTTRRGVTTSSWGSYRMSYTVEAAKP